MSGGQRQHDNNVVRGTVRVDEGTFWLLALARVTRGALGSAPVLPASSRKASLNIGREK